MKVIQKKPATNSKLGPMTRPGGSLTAALACDAHFSRIKHQLQQQRQQQLVAAIAKVLVVLVVLVVVLFVF